MVLRCVSKWKKRHKKNILFNWYCNAHLSKEDPSMNNRDVWKQKFTVRWWWRAQGAYGIRTQLALPPCPLAKSREEPCSTVQEEVQFFLCGRIKKKSNIKRSFAMRREISCFKRSTVVPTWLSCHSLWFWWHWGLRTFLKAEERDKRTINKQQWLGLSK